jgi:uncharacterized membrane protein
MSPHDRGYGNRGNDFMANQNISTGLSVSAAYPAVRKISVADLKDALSEGWDDFRAAPTQLIFLIYPVLGVILARAASGNSLLHLIYPLVTGFALVTPLFALGIYEISRRRERGEPVSWLNVFDVLHSKSIVSIGLLGLMLLAIFLIWLDCAHGIYRSIFGASTPDSISGFIDQLFTTKSGLQLFIVGNLSGLIFAALVLTLTVISFPLLLDRPVGAVTAIITSVRAVLANPVPMAVWGLIVAAGLLLSSLLLFVGLAVALPVLGHATWHLYRKVIAPAGK